MRGDLRRDAVCRHHRAMAPPPPPPGHGASPATERAIGSAIASRFATRIRRGYVRGKLAGDPVYAAIAGVLAGAPPLPLLDIGCGMGLLGQYLHDHGLLHGYLGIDHDARKIDAARDAAAALGDALQWRRADAAELPDFHGHVALLDVLHYLPAARQAPLLALAARHLAPSGRLLIRNVLREANWRYHATRVEEFFLHATGWMRVGAQHYPSAAELRSALENAGLSVRIAPLRGHTPFNSYLVVAQWPGREP
jgi:2-polyprenyl-3-methyl-5-hydroxy-6-metoxy-1,4-benzoquinol methylase